MIDIKLEQQSNGTVHVLGVNGRPPGIPPSFADGQVALAWVKNHSGVRTHDERTLTDIVSGVYRVQTGKNEG